MIYVFEVEDSDYFSNKITFFVCFLQPSHHVFRKREKNDFEVRPFDRKRDFGISLDKRMRITTKSKF